MSLILPGEPIPQHEFGARVEATHMCPECGLPPKIFCTTCAGTGNVTSAQLGAWQRKQWDGVEV